MYFQFLILGLFSCSYRVCGVNFDPTKIFKIKLNEKDKLSGTFFGYSLLLQSGTTPIVIVGAPKQSNKTGGSIFSCEIFTNNSCVKYSTKTGSFGTFNGNFLGVSLDGEDEIGKPFITCAPRKVTQSGYGANLNYFLKGTCFYIKNSSLLSNNIEINPLKNQKPIGLSKSVFYHNYAFSQAGIDVVYQKESFSVILGAPGVKNWNGALVVQPLNLLSDYKIVPMRSHPVEEEDHQYLGYKVGFGSNFKNLFIYAGAPRAENLFGKVKLFNYDKNYELYRSLEGEEFGAYFGSVILALDVNDDGYDDLFIGAPTAAGASYDEGCVYYYTNAKGTASKLFGDGKKASRFGSNIVSLGDIDLDSFNDVAVAAPFENDGMGVVYIFMGKKDGITSTYSQRIVPSSFPGYNVNIRGFGQGMSRGNDVDGNGHNDLAIGAFLSGDVIVILTKSVIDFRTALDSNVTSVTANDRQIRLKCCVYYKPRSKLGNLKTIDFQMKLLMDNRVKGSKIYYKNITAFSDETACQQIDIQLEQSVIDVVPFQFSLHTNVLANVYAEGTTVLERSVPYVHGCGDDNICQTQILIGVVTKTKRIIAGLDEVLHVKVSADNVGEPGYQCELQITTPKELQLSERKCLFENSTYTCAFASKLLLVAEKEVSFDILPTILTDSINITFEVKCLGENINNKEVLNVPVNIINSPYIEGSSKPEDFEVSENNSDKDSDVEIQHSFVVGNFGPSPVKTDLHLLMPTVKLDNEDLFKLVEAKAILGGIQVSCYPINRTDHSVKNFNASSLVKASLNKTILLDCYEKGINCLELFCEGDYLYKSSETAKYYLKFKTTNNLLAKFFKSQPEEKNVIAYVTSALLFNGTYIENHAVTLLFSLHSESLPLWVYITASTIGILLLALVIFIFYKCHFFDRRYRDKINDERLLDEPIELGVEESKTMEDKPVDEYTESDINQLDED